MDRIDVSLNWNLSLVERLKWVVAGFKLGLPFLLKYGVEGFRRVAGEAGRDKLLIVDFKLADIGSVMSRVATLLIDMGYNAVIAHAFVGRENGLQDLKKTLDREKAKLILVVSMSHKGSIEVIDQCYDKLIGMAVSIRPWGIVAPATRPETIRKVREDTSGVDPRPVILAPGVGVQGGDPCSAFHAGADYIIVGRAITRSEDPFRAVKMIEDTCKS